MFACFSITQVYAVFKGTADESTTSKTTLARMHARMHAHATNTRAHMHIQAISHFHAHSTQSEPPHSHFQHTILLDTRIRTHTTFKPSLSRSSFKPSLTRSKLNTEGSLEVAASASASGEQEEVRSLLSSVTPAAPAISVSL